MDAEPVTQPPLMPELSFPVDYQVFAGREYNRDLRGSGTFITAAGGAFCRFTGRSRSYFHRGVQQLGFGAHEISNVVREGRLVRFTTPLGRSGKQKAPFVFFCRDEAAAETVVGLLPRTVDQEFLEKQEFYGRLQSVSRAQNPSFSVTNAIIALNVAAFLVMVLFFGCSWFKVTDLAPYIRCGASNAGATTDGQWWRLLTAMFIHYGIAHLALNMWALHQIGQLVERLLGRALFALTYLGAGLAGGMLSLVWNGDRMWSAGASGAIFGIYGALLGYMLRERHGLPKSVLQPLRRSTLLFAGYNLLWGLLYPGIDNADHVGGIIGGCLFGYICAIPVSKASRANLTGERFLFGTLALLLIACLGMAAAPRYPYVMSDELAWAVATRDFVRDEPALVQRENSALQRLNQTTLEAPDLISLIENELMPFYAGCAKRINALEFTEGRTTELRRRKLAAFLRYKAEGFKRLDKALRKHEAFDFQMYEMYEKLAGDTIKAMKNQAE